MADLDSRVRLAAFRFLEEQEVLHPDTLPYEVLLRGFDFEGRRVPLLGPQGIFKPAILPDIPLSIATAPVVPGKPRPYEDELGPDGLIRYRYRGTDPAHRDNAGLRLAMRRGVPLVYLHGIVPGRYVAAWPAYVVADDPGRLAFTVAVDDRRRLLVAPPEAPVVAEARRAYVTSLAVRRLHQRTFRERVLQAYRVRCAVCRFRHQELLEAAHILPDGHPRGEPVVPNGLALCSLHHAASDRHLLGIRPDLTVELRVDVLRASDGPTLQHGLLRFQGAALAVPRRAELRPNPDFLAERYEIFRKAG